MSSFLFAFFLIVPSVRIHNKYQLTDAAHGLMQTLYSLKQNLNR